MIFIILIVVIVSILAIIFIGVFYEKNYKGEFLMSVISASTSIIFASIAIVEIYQSNSHFQKLYQPWISIEGTENKTKENGELITILKMKNYGQTPAILQNGKITLINYDDKSVITESDTGTFGVEINPGQTLDFPLPLPKDKKITIQIIIPCIDRGTQKNVCDLNQKLQYTPGLQQLMIINRN